MERDMTESYTPGYTRTASDFMAQRSAASHAAFVLPRLRSDHRLLDCGCGPGSISCDFAQILESGRVHGIDREESQVRLARDLALQRDIPNARFEVASIYQLPFDDSSFDVVFAHAIFEHISAPDVALAEMLRVLAPGGMAAIRSPDWGGFLVGPDLPGLQDAIHNYAELQTANGGDVHVGRKLPGLLRKAGCGKIEFSATYDCYQSPTMIADYLSLKLNDDDAKAFRRWSEDPDAFFAQAWCEAVGHKV